MRRMDEAEIRAFLTAGTRTGKLAVSGSTAARWSSPSGS